MLDGRSRRGPRPQRQDRNLRAQGLTLAAIADSLNFDGVPTAQGGARWHPSINAEALVIRELILPEPTPVPEPCDPADRE